MCGIVGYWDKNGIDRAALHTMADQLKHRGPDDAGLWLNNQGDLGLAHRRLSIIDLSSAGHQPMTSPCGNFTIVFNGEIYNHLEIRKELADIGAYNNWIGHSDTETLLIALRHWGIHNTLQRLNGMFAFALWNNSTNTLTLARDRIGEKPLYYGVNNHSFVFGSELKCITAHPRWNAEIDRTALTLYMRHNYVPAPLSIYTGIKKLLPGHFVTVKEYGSFVSEPSCYWDLINISQNTARDESSQANNLIGELDDLLNDAISMRMVADVPLGAFLSGGIDSSTVTAIMQQQSSSPIRTFSIGFLDSEYNEAKYAKSIAKHLGTVHTELYITPSEALDVIPQLPDIWDEPFSDSSQIPTFLVSKLTRQHVTVSLSGDGGDELFCGYNRYIKGFNTWKLVKPLPLATRKLLANLLSRLSGTGLEHALKILPKRLQIPHLADRLQKLADVISVSSGKEYYHRLTSHWKNPTNVVINGYEPDTICSNYIDSSSFNDLREYMMLMDTMTYLPDDILTKVDRASMSVSLEARVPLLDHRIVEFSWKLPISLKYRNNQSKWALRQVLNKYIPTELTDRPKMGFAVPLGEWLKGPLRDWAENLLAEQRLTEQGFLNSTPIRKMWLEHVNGDRRWHYYLWDVLMFQAWLESNS